MPTLNKTVAAQAAVLNELLNCPGLDEQQAISTLEQQTAVLQELVAGSRANERTAPVKKAPAPAEPPAEQPAQGDAPSPAPAQGDPPANTNPDGKTKELPKMGADLATTAREFRAAWTPEEYARVASDVGSEVASAFDNASQVSEDGDVIAALSVLRGKNDIAERMQKVLGAKMAPASALFEAVRQA
jgi:hypothetical protein